VLSAGKTAALAVKLTVGVKLVGFQVTIDSFATGSCGATSRCRLHHHERGFVFLRHLGWRQPGLLQRGILAEQRFL
jgi:hypothetical protein